MSWRHQFSTYIWIFPVGRGNAAFVRSGLNHGFILDMAGGEFCDPAKFIRDNFVKKLTKYKHNNGEFSIAQAILSHPHGDHIAQCAKLGLEVSRSALYPALLTCPHDQNMQDGTPSGEKINWERVKNPEGQEDLKDAYQALYAKRFPPLQTIRFTERETINALEYGIFYVRPPKAESLHPKDDNKYANCTSIIFYLRHGQNSILFPGDMTPEGMEHILGEREGSEKRYTVFSRSVTSGHEKWHEKTSDQPGLRPLLRSRGLSILVAPHHGLESCFSADLYAAMKGSKPQLVVISERRHVRENDGKVHAHYQKEEGASGLTVTVEGEKEFRRSVSTVNGQHILIEFSGDGVPRVSVDEDPKRLLELAFE